MATPVREEERPAAQLIRATTSARVFALAFGDSYTTCFYAALRRLGIEVCEGGWSGRWLRANVQSGDVVHLHWPSFIYTDPGSALRTWWRLLRFTLVAFLLRRYGVRLVWTAHNLYPHDDGRALVHRLARKIVVRLCSRICVHGPAAAARVQREFHVPTRSLVILEHGNWIDYYPNVTPRTIARQRLKIPQDAYVHLFIGLCKPYKNLEYLVRTYTALKDGSLLWIVGRFSSENYRRQVKEAAGGGEAGRITFVDDYVKDEDLQVYLNACDAVILPYREVLTSGVAMLALSFGRPVVAPRIGPLTELVTQQCGVLYDPDVDSALSDALLRVRSSTFDQSAIVTRAQQFSWARSAEIFAQAVLPRHRTATEPPA